jgi:hypothetical protein
MVFNFFIFAWPPQHVVPTPICMARPTYSNLHMYMVEPTCPAHQNPTNRPIRMTHYNLAGRPNMPGLPQSACRPLIRLPKSAYYLFRRPRSSGRP